jgi:hypothetical protein
MNISFFFQRGDVGFSAHYDIFGMIFDFNFDRSAFAVFGFVFRVIADDVAVFNGLEDG